MGLDMYIIKRTFVGAEYDHKKMKGQVSIRNAEGVSLGIKFKRVSYVEEAVGYWRKANQIHAWFVKNTQNGVDECQRTEVPLDKLKELLSTCRSILKHKSIKKAQELLPPQGGFFFGNTDYNECYFRDLKSTVKILSPLIKEIEALRTKGIYASIIYQSSW